MNAREPPILAHPSQLVARAACVPETSRMPNRVVKSLLRLPAALYRAHAGWILGHRFLCLTHRGRRSGRRYSTVLEVLAWKPATREAVVISGFGRKANWYRNVLADGAVEVEIARECWLPQARALEPEEAVGVLADYERRNRLLAPVVRRVLSRLAHLDYDGSPASRLAVVDALPLVAFRPRDLSAT
jgi:deazaflavin-dependent oxidoreductase (nitroreductase family)